MYNNSFANDVGAVAGVFGKRTRDEALQDLTNYLKRYDTEGKTGDVPEGITGDRRDDTGSSDQSGADDRGAAETAQRGTDTDSPADNEESRGEQVLGVEAEQETPEDTQDTQTPIQGLDGYTTEELEANITNWVEDAMSYSSPSEFTITGVKVVGSRTTDTAHEDSDLDVLVEYEGSMSEDGVFNILNAKDGRMVIEGITVDFNPLNRAKSGTISDWLERNKEYKREDTQEKQADDTRFRFARDTRDFDRVQKEAVEKKGLVMPNLNDMSVEVVSVPKHDFKGDKPIIQAREWANNNLVTTEHDRANNNLPKLIDGTPYEISANAIDKFLSETATSKSSNLGVHVAVLKELKKVIGASIEAEVHPDYNKKDGVRSVENGYNDNLLIHRFYGAVEIDGQTYRVKTTINEFRDESRANTPYTYEVIKIELLETSNSSKMELNSPNSVNEGLSIEATKLLQGVEKSYDKGKKLLEESENIDTDDVRFHTAWHGSPHVFDRFSTDYIGTGEGAQSYGWGLYFTDKEGIARSYAKNNHDAKFIENKAINQITRDELKYRRFN